VIASLRPAFPRLSVHRMCALLGVPRSLVYRRSRSPDWRTSLLKEVEEIVTTWLGYGYRRVHRELRRRGFTLGEHRVRRVMREEGLWSRSSHRPQGVTRRRKGDAVFPNLVKGRAPESINEIWVADMTRIRTDSGPCYLASLIDLHSRKVVAWSVSRRPNTELALACLEAALEKRRPDAGWIHHSDQGSTYTARDYVSRVLLSKGRMSMSRAGCPIENAFAESFFRTLKSEEVHLNSYASYLELEASLSRYIDGSYNTTRMHSALGYRSPDEFEASPKEGPTN